MESEYELPVYALEKDYHVFDAIKILASIPRNPHFRLVFCGGTCLSKAYRILSRMSEDVDFKIVPSQEGALLSKTALRRSLSSFRAEIVEALGDRGFGAENIEKSSRDEGKYTALKIRYESHFERAEALRSELLIELNFAETTTETETREIGLLYESLADLANSSPVRIDCVGMREAYVEKLVSFPRRLALHLKRQGQEGAGEWDRALVRHLYDVHQIKAKYPEIESDLRTVSELLLAVIEKDACDFAYQHPDFLSDPKAELLGAMAHAKSSAEIREQYDYFVRDMVYAPIESTPTFDEAIDGFLDSLTRSLPPKINLQNRG